MPVSVLIIALMFEDHGAIVEKKGSSQARGEPVDAVSMATAPSTFRALTPIRGSLSTANDGNREAGALGWTWRLWDSVPSSTSCLRVAFSEAAQLRVSPSPSLEWGS